MAVNCLHASAFSTLMSFVGLQWWTAVLLDRIKSDGLMDETGIHSSNATHILELLLGSPVTITLLVTFLLNVFVLVILCLKTIFFVQLYPSETRKVLERVINYVIYKGTFLPLVVPPNGHQVAFWSTWMIVLCSLKMFQTLARDRLERLNASPSATPWTYFRVFSALLLVLSADFLWIRLCMILCKAVGSSMFLLLFFEPLSIAFETLQAIMVHGFQLLEMWQRHSVDDSTDCVGPSNKSTAGSIWEWKGNLMRNFGFLLEMMTLLMALGHYLTIWWLHGMAFHLVDAVLFLNLRALVTAVIKRMKGYIKLRKALSSLNGALPDATYDELGAYDDECAICREPMAKAKRLSCNHLFHLPCLRSWLDHGQSEVYSCPTCRRPLFPSNGRDYSGPRAGEVSNVERNVPQVNLGSDQQRVSDVLPIEELPNQQLNPYDVWREPGLGPNWVTPRPNPGMDGAGTSAIRPVGLGRVQMMMRHLASVGETYAHGALEDSSWNVWSAQLHSGSSVPPPSSSLRNNNNRHGGGALRVRNASPSGNGNLSDILAMAERVREILPHIPDELILEDLRRTNNATATVNNFLPT